MKDFSKAYIALFTGVALIGLSPILIKMADAPGIVTSFYRMVFGVLVLSIPVFINFSKTKWSINKKGLGTAILGGLFFSGDMALWSTGIVSSNATLPTIVANLSPLWVGLGAIFIFKERQNLGFWIGVLLAILGMVLLVLNDIFESNHIALKGVFFGLMAGVFYALFHLFTQSGRKLLDTLSYLYFSTISTGFFLGIMLLIFGYPFTGYSNETWLLWFIMGVAVQAGAWFLINFAQGFISASVVAPSLLVQPLITGIIAVAFLNERLTVWHMLGGFVIMGGIYIVHFSKRKTRKS